MNRKSDYSLVSDVSKSMEAFLEWMMKHGAQQFGVEIRDCTDKKGKGVFATRSFRENDTLICVPPALIITAGTVADTPRHTQFFRRLLLFSRVELWFIESV